MLKSLFLILLLVIAAQAQIGPCAIQTGPLLPDLVSLPNDARNSAFVSVESFVSTDCALAESCIDTPGSHRLLRFDGNIKNVGAVDLTIGNPANCPGLYEFSACHGHYHLHDSTVYRLWTPSGWTQWKSGRDLSQPASSPSNQALLNALEATGSLIRSRKQGFCLRDDIWCGNCNKCRCPSISGYDLYTNCSTNQGLSWGWIDTYPASLPCQFIVIDSLASGAYYLEIQVDPEHWFPQSNYLNDSSAVRLNL